MERSPMVKNFLIVTFLAAALASTTETSSAGQVGDLDSPFSVPAGQFVIVAPPQGSDKGKPVVFSSTPPSRWTPYLSYEGKPFNAETAQECAVALATLRYGAADMRLKRTEKEITAKKGADKRFAEKESVKADLKFVLLKHAECQESDGSARFMIRPTI